MHFLFNANQSLWIQKEKGTLWPRPHKKSSCKPAHCFCHLSPFEVLLTIEWMELIMLARGALAGAAHQSWQFALLTDMMIFSKLICVPFTQTSRSIYEAQTSLRRDLKDKEKGECDPSVVRFNCSIRGWFYRRGPSPKTSDNPSVHIFAFVHGKLKTWNSCEDEMENKAKKKKALQWMSH